MAKTLTPEEAVERARRVQDDRINAIRGLAEARAQVERVRDETARELSELQASIAQRVGEVERHDVKAYNAALSAGWTSDELRKIGFAEPDKKARTRRRAARKPAASDGAGPTVHEAGPAASTGEGGRAA
ncbi:hypothetical protein AAG589_21075 [Isoptericola sp. F-RaC21]|uniref:hypothetical protein n=1 Tax=Isoptericola sp. F-RaC21 TaxID=3141452 RepID=UPI00315B99A5